MALYPVSVGSPPMASDVNQLIDLFAGIHDVGKITFAPVLSAPISTSFTVTAVTGSTLGVGAYQYEFTYVTGYYKTDGTLLITGETTVSSMVSITTTSGSTSVQITLPTTGLPASAVAIRIYRTAVGGATYGLVTTVKAGTSGYTDSIADASLGTVPPASNTTGTYVADVGQISTLKTNTKTSIVNAINEHVTDFVSNVKYGAATGSANVYAVTLSPAPTSYGDGMAVAVKINVDATGASTLNVNSLGAVPLKGTTGNDITNLKTNGVYTFRYNATTGNFILQGEGSDPSSLITATNGILGS